MDNLREVNIVIIFVPLVMLGLHIQTRWKLFILRLLGVFIILHLQQKLYGLIQSHEIKYSIQLLVPEVKPLLPFQSFELRQREIMDQPVVSVVYVIWPFKREIALAISKFGLRFYIGYFFQCWVVRGNEMAIFRYLKVKLNEVYALGNGCRVGAEGVLWELAHRTPVSY